MKQNIILIKYGDLYLKGKNKQEFINSLISNIKNALFDFDFKIEKEFDNSKIFFKKSENEKEIIEILKHIPGISFIIPCIILERNIEIFKSEILKEFNNSGTFKIETKRKDKKYHISSLEFNRLMGTWILKNNNKYKVNIHKPDIFLSVEITKNHFIYFLKKIKGISGLPIGLNGKCLVLLSGGIDSSVAGYLLQRKGIKVDYITFITPPYTSNESLEKVKKLVEIISLNGRIFHSKLYVINFTNILNELLHTDENYRIILMRRIFLKIALGISKKKHFDFIATGDSLGQVASQTIESMNCISQACSDFLLLRPLLTFSKDEIIKVAKEIGTYETSNLPYEDSCSMFVPKNPVTKPKMEKIIKLESKLEFINQLINKAINDI